MQFSSDELEAFTCELGTPAVLTLGDGTKRSGRVVYNPPARNVPIAGVGVVSFDRRAFASASFVVGARAQEARLKFEGEPEYLISELNPDGAGLVELVLVEP